LSAFKRVPMQRDAVLRPCLGLTSSASVLTILLQDNIPPQFKVEHRIANSYYCSNGPFFQKCGYQELAKYFC